MAFSDILKLKKVEEVKEEKIFIKNAVIGFGVFAIDLCSHLNRIEPGSAKILTSDAIDEANLKILGPSLVRGEENISAISKVVEGLEVYNSQFYKELKFHDFGKRTKPQTLLWGEEFFTADHVNVELEELLPVLKEENLLEKIIEQSLVVKISKIEKAIPEDLIDQANFKITCTNGLVIECEQIFYSHTPDTFYELFKDKRALTDNFVAFCESTKTPCALYFHMELEEELTDSKNTFFFPLSFTHDWGHFIGEFEKTEKGQLARFVTFINKEETTEEDISKKLRLLKKNFEKSFEKFNEKKCREFVVLRENTYCPKIDDNFLEEEKDELDKLTFIGFNAPFSARLRKNQNFEDSNLETSLLTRALLVQRLIKG
ncbi:hypothetical protein [Bacteriovorax sp. Seq25_V]|uniref:hypothetical protein n=1 Tax=Bacteriovorax sp. Seq25_V TaxID=1201288 RepID=UPI00038A1DF8|nr:hypothetical protein [Bacteriovorax sp. Seq25_V]EQC44764.1 hypothetical protein M900_0416 [Bacteriovorax sp. Seq25_V]